MHNLPPWRLQTVRRGPIYMMLAALSFTLMVVSLKVARQSLGPLNITIWRSILALPFVVAVAWPSGFYLRRWRLVALRCALGFGAVYCMTTAAAGLGVFELSLLHKVQPLWVAVFAPLFLGAEERAGARTAVALVVGLLGSLLIVYRPTGDYSAPVLASGAWALAGTFCSSLAHVTLRALGRSESPRTVVFWFHLSLLPLAALTLAAPLPHGEAFEWPKFAWLPALVGVGLTAALGQLLLTTAYKLERAASVAAASYVGPLWALAADWLIFSAVPRLPALAGGALVLVAGALVAWAPSGGEGRP